ncbi:unnamed protein product [Mytilus edulis]|uniref:Endonuclease/exonuclease/phosphatase domain-containing protein n=1 Tax=Mytilus edulis TaxID=6550 RepID=A0A8S3VAA3_MYTED|nr:unnamed protein product [Mytilus edulis]
MGSIILMGDFNTKIQGPRYKFNPDERSRLMYSLIQEYELFSVNTQMFCHGPVTTFQSYDNGPSTCIDHILMPLSEIGKVSNAKVIDSQPFSVSDHRPILCSITIENSVLTHTEGEQSTRSVSWDRARKFGYINDYSFALSQHLWTSEFPRHEINKLIIEDYYDKIVSAIKQAEQETLPYSIFKPYQKPYWNKSLTHLRDMMRLKRIEWLNNCNCHDLNAMRSIITSRRKGLFVTLKDPQLTNMKVLLRRKLKMTLTLTKSPYGSFLISGNRSHTPVQL